MNMKTATNMIRGKVLSTVATAGSLLKMSFTGRADEKIEDRSVYQCFGIQSRPKKDTEIISLRQGRTIVIVATDHPSYRIALEDGDVVVYSDINNFVKLLGAGGMRVVSSADITVEAKTAVIKADSLLLGDENGTKKLVTEDALIPIRDHTHPLGTVTVPKSTDALMMALNTDPRNKTSIVEAK